MLKKVNIDNVKYVAKNVTFSFAHSEKFINGNYNLYAIDTETNKTIFVNTGCWCEVSICVMKERNETVGSIISKYNKLNASEKHDLIYDNTNGFDFDFSSDFEKAGYELVFDDGSTVYCNN